VARVMAAYPPPRPSRCPSRSKARPGIIITSKGLPASKTAPPDKNVVSNQAQRYLFTNCACHNLRSCAGMGAYFLTILPWFAIFICGAGFQNAVGWHRPQSRNRVCKRDAVTTTQKTEGGRTHTHTHTVSPLCTHTSKDKNKCKHTLAKGSEHQSSVAYPDGKTTCLQLCLSLQEGIFSLSLQPDNKVAVTAWQMSVQRDVGRYMGQHYLFLAHFPLK
jgi:hypothetical protein